jgi:hypothetical protein
MALISEYLANNNKSKPEGDQTIETMKSTEGKSGGELITKAVAHYRESDVYQAHVARSAGYKDRAVRSYVSSHVSTPLYY